MAGRGGAVGLGDRLRRDEWLSGNIVRRISERLWRLSQQRYYGQPAYSPGSSLLGSLFNQQPTYQQPTYYQQPAYYQQPTYYQPPPQVVTQPRYVPVPVASNPRPPRDRNNNGVPDWKERDRNGDGVPDWQQRRNRSG